MVANMVLYIPKEGLQRSPEEASTDKKPAQRVENQRAAVCPENDENDGYIWLLERGGLLEKLLCQSDGHISQQVEKTEVRQKPEVKQIKRI
ncbi:uncharacterized protein AKAME5_000633000 [Lates japonicus]|uniref:Uncharacterized protein n=1 Tax=Lates japonicus TaxID=270547 RepID=A0AAD3MGQ8_LATJO|nr:uncharacterized protein AKAME5_000633000 [Lates japonicus]